VRRGRALGLHSQIAPGDFHHLLLVEALDKGLRETVFKADGTSFVLDLARWISDQGQ